MSSQSNPDHLRRFLLFLWVLATLGFIYWMRPNFWLEPGQNYVKARDLRQAGNSSEALNSINKAIADDPGNAGYRMFRGYLFQDLGRPGDAEVEFAEGARLEPANLRAKLALAEAQARLGRKDEARRLLVSLPEAKLTPEQRLHRSQIYSALGDTEAALSDLKILVGPRPSGPAGEQALAEALALAVARQDFALAAALPTPSAAVNGTMGDATAQAINNKAIALRATGQFAEAYSLFSEAPSAANLRARAELALQLEKYAEAADLYGQLLQGRTDDVPAQEIRAYALQRSGDKDGARGAYAQALATGQASKEARIRYAWLLNEMGRHREAWEALAPLPRPDPDPKILELQARTAYWAGEMDIAAPLLQALVDGRN